LGVVGTQDTVAGVVQWLEQCRDPIAAKPKNRLPNLFVPFPGCSAVFGVDLVLDPVFRATIPPRDAEKLIPLATTPEGVDAAVGVFLREADYLVETTKPHVVICAPPADLLNALEHQEETEPSDDDAVEENDEDTARIRRRAFHDVLKARGMRLGVPIQMVRPETYDDRRKRKQVENKERDRELQDPATRAWNFVTALYYKANGTPWRVAPGDEYSTCFVGVSFYRTLDEELVMSSMAQVFNRKGEGVVVRGCQARVDKLDRTPHLEEADARSLLGTALATFRQEHHQAPARIVVHKTSAFDAGETAGFRAGAADADIYTLDLLSVTRPLTRLFRRGYYPPLRGTFATLDELTYLLYLKGSVNFYRTWPGLYVPRPLRMRLEAVQERPRVLAMDILALSKQNWNATNFDGGWPITVRAAQRVGSILKHLDNKDPVQARYSYYM
jgi:hypothetical protein